MSASPTIAVSSWSLHRTLGQRVADGAFPWGGMAVHAGDGMDLLDLPAALAEHGFHRLQLCHFHLPSRDADSLAALRDALSAADVELDALLLDTGDLTSPDDGDEVESWAAGWLRDAATLGARRVRMIAGRRPPTPDAIDRSALRLRRLADGAPQVRVVTENWYELMPDPASVQRLLAGTAGTVGFLIDLGNWSGAGKYDALRAVAPLAETCHAKCHTTAEGELEEEDYVASLQILADAGFTGSLALVHDGPRIPEWEALDRERAIVQRVFAG